MPGWLKSLAPKQAPLMLIGLLTGMTLGALLAPGVHPPATALTKPAYTLGFGVLGALTGLLFDASRRTAR